MAVLPGEDLLLNADYGELWLLLLVKVHRIEETSANDAVNWFDTHEPAASQGINAGASNYSAPQVIDG